MYRRARHPSRPSRVPRRIGQLLALAIAVPTISASGGEPAPELVGEVQVEAVPQNVLAAVVRFESSEPVRARVRVTGPRHRFTVRERQEQRDHVVPILGLRPDSEYRFTVELGSDSDAASPVTFTAGSLPPDLPSIEITNSTPSDTARGWTLFSATRRMDPPAAPGEDAPNLGYLMAVDRTGQVVWYHVAPSPIADARVLANGNILYEYNNLAAREIDALGNVVREWAGRLVRGRLAQDQFGRTIVGPDAIPVETDSMHHEIGELPNGNFITLSTERREVDGFTEPQCGEPVDAFTGSYQLIADVVVEFEPDTGNVVREIPIADVLQPQSEPADANICGIDLPQIVPNFFYVDLGEARDWTHGNSVVLDEERNALLVSIRHLDAVFAFRYEADDDGPAGELLWRLGPDGDLRLRGDGDWQYHQHAPKVEDDGSLLIYDNGNGRPGTDEMSDDPDELPFSRVVQYELRGDGDVPAAVEQAFELRSEIDGVPAYAFFVGDVDRLPNGNLLVTNGGVTDHPSGVGVQLVEVEPDRDGSARVVFELRIPTEEWFSYRAERIRPLVADGTTRR
jgi:hypothetical protein